MRSSFLYPVTILPFIGNVGPTFTLSESPIDIFTVELMDKIVNQSKLNASQVMKSKKI